MALRLSRFSHSIRAICQVRCMSDGTPGSGAGVGGGSGGTVRNAGGAFGKMEQAHEEQYFKRLQAEQLKALHDHLYDEIRYHEKEIEDHQADIQRHKEKLAKLQNLKKE